jgi:hypothetical protein
MNTKIIWSIFAASIVFSTTASAITRPEQPHLGFYAQGRIVSAHPAPPYIAVDANHPFSSWNSHHTAQVFNNWYQTKRWEPGYTVIQGDHAKCLPGGWVFKD